MWFSKRAVATIGPTGSKLGSLEFHTGYDLRTSNKNWRIASIIDSAEHPVRCRFYSCQIIRNGEVIADYRPFQRRVSKSLFIVDVISNKIMPISGGLLEP